jgi:formylglycine-generating enzyme required for sulfatase activity
MNLMKILSSTGKAHIKEPNQLKYLLCPIIAQSKAEQERFYTAFDRYWEEIYQPVEEAKLKWWERLPKWFWLIPILFVIGSLGYLIYEHLTIGSGEKPVLMMGNMSGKVGDTVLITNNSLNFDSTKTNFKWEVIHRKTDSVEIVEEDSKHLEYVVPAKPGFPQKLIRLTSEHTETKKRDTTESFFVIMCVNKPVVEILIDKEELRARDTVSLKALSDEVENYDIHWNLGKGYDYFEPEIKHIFDRVGSYRINLKATRKNADGQCVTTIEKTLSVGTDKAFLDLMTLEKAEFKPIAQFGLGTWILMGILAIGCIYYWVRFWYERNEKPAEETPKEAEQKPKFPDRGPYFIPFRNQESNIRFERQLFRFADVLRQRQEGLRQNINVSESLKATIDSGGFPNLRYSTNTTPTEYLFLIDQQSAHSHQAKLFEYLISFLGEKDVLVDTFHYNKNFHRFWNNDFPKGIQPEILRRQFGNHRLVIMGDAHEMLDPFSKDKPTIKKETKKLFEQWKYRLLLTPLPEVSWTYREGVLHHSFSIFPCDVEGLTEAIKYLEMGREEEDFVPFDRWRETIRKSTPDPDVNYRRWRTFAEHQDYLKDHPRVFEWLCATALYAKPTWEITIAIGNALKDFGVEVNYDNLLLLSRIPWLQTGNLKPRLREELINHLPNDVKSAAREAISEELEAVKESIENSHASREWETENALQKYALAPESLENQELIRTLHQKGYFSKKQESELKVTYYQNLEAAEQQFKRKAFKKAAYVPPLDFEDFLETAPKPEFKRAENKPTEPKEKPSIFTKNFYLGMTSSLLYLLIALLVYNMDGTEQLDSLIFNKEHPPIYDNENLRDYFFIKEDFVIDSAVVMNNQAVKFWESYAEPRLSVSEINRPQGIRVFESPRDFDTYRIVFESAERNLNNAIEYWSDDWDLAKKNLAKLNYNLGTILYQMVLADSADASSLNSARSHFKATMKYDSMRLDGLHGMGLTHYYDLGSDSTMWFYNQIIEENKDYFMTARVPNLETLLDIRLELPEPPPVPGLEEEPPTSTKEETPQEEPPIVNEYPETNFLGYWETVLENGGSEYLHFTKDKQVKNRTYGGSKLVLAERGKWTYNDKNLELNWKSMPTRVASIKWFNQNQFEMTILSNQANQQSLQVQSYQRVEEIYLPYADEDSDGVIDMEDECPYMKNLAGENNGCPPDIRVSPEEGEWLSGQWEGTAQQINPPVTWNVAYKFDFDKGIYEVEYPLINCKTPLSIIEIGDNQAILRENYLDNGNKGCADGSMILVELLTDGALELSYLHPNTNRLNVSAEVRKKVEIPIPEMVFVKGGTFTMGCTWDTDEFKCLNGEYPKHEVILDDFSIGKYEVTYAEFVAFLNDYGSTKIKGSEYEGQDILSEEHQNITFQTIADKINFQVEKGFENHPVTSITWYGALEYSKWLSQKTGEYWSLPTEAEWEYAARGGVYSKDNYVYSGSNYPLEVAWILDNAEKRTHSVGLKKANQLGIYDMSGNVWEWCLDWSSNIYFNQYAQKTADNPKGPNEGKVRVTRGGSMLNIENLCRVSNRYGYLPDYKYQNIGFRIIRK